MVPWGALFVGAGDQIFERKYHLYRFFLFLGFLLGGGNGALQTGIIIKLIPGTWKNDTGY